MKKLLLVSLFVLSVIPFFDSCKPDEPEPDPDPRDKFVARWQCRETSSVFGLSNYQVQIGLNTANETQVFLTNFYQFGQTDQAYAIASGNQITIPNQSFCDHTISGNGTIDSKYVTITWDYIVVNTGAESDTCSAIYEKIQ
ncbi:MAG: hypothetical protein KKA07_04975 [Bacteroidetes bacterium]|nr:hypothetical protein [Bacteroidota bacterium]MBU1718405.1 hypothetical protein [Bacteroidota bacterium]